MTVLGKTVKMVTTSSAEIIREDIDEYVCGFHYLYFRFKDGGTESFSRETILAAYRRLPTGEYRQIHLKKVKVYPNDEEDED